MLIGCGKEEKKVCVRYVNSTYVVKEVVGHDYLGHELYEDVSHIKTECAQFATLDN